MTSNSLSIPADGSVVRGTSESPLLDIRNLTIAYGDALPSVVDVDLRVGPGEIVGLIGESGSGKSTVAMAALGLLPWDARVTADEFAVCGVDLRSATPQQLNTIRGASIAMVFQDAMGALDPCMRIGAQIAEVVKRHQKLDGRARRAEMHDLMTRVGLPEPEKVARMFPHQLSGGLRQRAAIALALAGKPRILLADEPTTALDVTVQAGILRLFREIRDELNVAIVLISHDMGVVAQTCDRVAVMLEGEVVEQGPVEQVLLNPSTDYSRRLLDAAPTLDTATVVAMPSETLSDDCEVVLEATNVTRHFRARGRHITAVNDVSLAVKRGEVLGVVGESGSGKSTLAKLLIRLDKPSDGTLSIEGVDFRRLRGSRARRIRGMVQMVFQHPGGSLNPRLRIGASVREPIRSNGRGRDAADARVLDLLREVGLPDGSAERLPHEFSGGQKQRIAIARALSSAPGVILLDEPTSALDVSVQAQVLDLLELVRSEYNLTYVFISHNLAVVRLVSHRVAVMYAGRIVEVGPSDAVFANAEHWYTRSLIAAVPSTDPRRRDAELAEAAAADALAQESGPSASEVSLERRSNPACAFAPRCPMAQVQCWEEEPELVEIFPGRSAACHFPRSSVLADAGVHVAEMG